MPLFGKPEHQLRERHDAADFETRTQDKLDTQSKDAGRYGGAPIGKTVAALAPRS